MKSRIFFTLLLALCPLYAMAQTSARSAVKSFRIVKEVKPPVLSVDRNSIRFVDAGNDNAITGCEKCSVHFTVTNSGYGDGYNCVARVSVSGSSRDISVKNVNLPVIGVGKSVDVTIPVEAGINAENGRITLNVSVDEPNGFGADPFTMDIPTREFESPMLKVTDYSVSGTSGTLQKKSKFDLRILLQNVAYGVAENVDVSVSVPDNIFILDGEQTRNYATISGGQTESLDFSLIANNNYSGNVIPITVTLHEKYGRYSENKVIELALNQELSGSRISVQENVPVSRGTITVATLGSAVDRNIPENPRKNNNTFAVIIANENYQNDAPVDYARNDGSVFRDYCVKTLGIPEDHVKLSLDATLNNINSQVAWVKSVADAYEGKASILFYYAGHGVPDNSNRRAYVLPVDGDGRNPAATGIALDDIYKKLASYNTKSTVVFMDACFSGAKRDGGMVDMARGVVISPEAVDPYGNLVIISAAKGSQTAYKFDEQKHGMFTYYLLKSLQETGGNETLGELSDYIITNVKQKSVVVNKMQEPNVRAGEKVAESWRSKPLSE